MSFVEAVQSVFSQYVGFSGRARRSEYWYFILFSVIAGTVVSFAVKATGINLISVIWSIALFLPSLAVCIRRLHDIGKSGWSYLFVLIPIVGIILLFIWFCRDSEPGENQYGPNPKGVN